eukprot:TRINITY_DN1333_c0_g5_i1.p1 TRINITY_DN1333_c0_g5~~TRINITY_DN1333_c0_g5_i1.p1  ORF type:complete len:253 (+),score=41.24 TRINITY_DN1333_c0_g5_i1:70-828(+)
MDSHKLRPQDLSGNWKGHAEPDPNVNGCPRNFQNWMLHFFPSTSADHILSCNGRGEVAADASSWNFSLTGQLDLNTMEFNITKSFQIDNQSHQVTFTGLLLTESQMTNEQGQRQLTFMFDGVWNNNWSGYSSTFLITHTCLLAPEAPIISEAGIAPAAARSNHHRQNESRGADAKQVEEQQQQQQQQQARAEKEKSLPECCLCMDQAVSSVLVPCYHVCLCVGCAQDLMQSPYARCPICRDRFQFFAKIYFQ